MCLPLCKGSLFAISAASFVSKLLCQAQPSEMVVLAHMWQQIKLGQLEQVLLVPWRSSQGHLDGMFSSS